MQRVYVAFHYVELNAVRVWVKIEDFHFEDEPIMVALFVLTFDSLYFILFDCYYIVLDFNIAFELVKQAD